MKIFIIILCFTSVRSTVCINGLPSPQWLNYPHRRLLIPHRYHRANPDLAKLIFLKRLLETDSIRNVYLKNCQRPPPATRFNGMSAYGNNGIYPATHNNLGKKYFVNPNLIILPPSTSMEVNNNLQNHKELEYKKMQQQHSRTMSEDARKTEDAKNEEQIWRKNYGEDKNPGLENAQSTVRKNDDNKTVPFDDGLSPHPNPLQPSTDTYPENVLNLFSLLKSGTTEIYKVEEIIEGSVNVDEFNLQKMKMSEGPYFENKMKSVSSDSKVLDKSIMKIIKGMNELPKYPLQTKNAFSEVFTDGSSVVQTTAPTQFQQYLRVLPSDVTTKPVFPVNGIPTDEGYSGREITQRPDLFSFNRPGYEHRPPTPVGDIHKTFEATPMATINHLPHAVSDEGITRKEARGPHRLFGFLNKEPSGKQDLKSEIISEKVLPFIPSGPFENISDAHSRDLIKNLIMNEPNLEMIVKSEPPNATPQLFPQGFDASVKRNNVTLIPFNLRPTQTPSVFSEEKATTPKTGQGRNDVSFTTPGSASMMSNSRASTSDFLYINLHSSTTKFELKKDEESNGKNSRKMHFSQNTQKETKFNRITEVSSTNPRRSDIIINDYTDDYNENQISTLSHLMKLISNDTVLTGGLSNNIDSYIPFIPEIVNDIRQNKISAENLSLLSNLFGKYWSNILAMSNSTKLDVLPLLTMKNEKDLIRFIEDNFSEEYKTSTTETDAVEIDSKDSLKPAYDYEGAYEDFYDYVLGHEVETKRKRLRHKRDDELRHQKVEANKEYFESLEEERQNGQVEYMVEYVMYDEPLDDDDVSVLELIRTADLNKKNETFKKRNQN